MPDTTTKESEYPGIIDWPADVDEPSSLIVNTAWKIAAYLDELAESHGMRLAEPTKVTRRRYIADGTTRVLVYQCLEGQPADVVAYAFETAADPLEEWIARLPDADQSLVYDNISVDIDWA